MTLLKDLLIQADQYHLELPIFPEYGLDLHIQIQARINHTILKAETLTARIEQVCTEARQHNFAAVCVNPVFLPLVTSRLGGSSVKVGTVVGFPLGANVTQTKDYEAHIALEQGAVELDLVIPVGLLKGGQYQAVLDDIQVVVDTAHQAGAIVKVILETCYLNRREKIIGCLLSQAAGADFVNTSTGYGTCGATIEDVDLMQRVVGNSTKMGVQASGGIRSLADARTMLKAGAARLGTSAGVKIMKELSAEQT